MFNYTVTVEANEAYLVGLLPLSALSIIKSWKKKVMAVEMRPKKILKMSLNRYM